MEVVHECHSCHCSHYHDHDQPTKEAAVTSYFELSMNRYVQVVRLTVKATVVLVPLCSSTWTARNTSTATATLLKANVDLPVVRWAASILLACTCTIVDYATT